MCIILLCYMVNNLNWREGPHVHVTSNLMRSHIVMGGVL